MPGNPHPWDDLLNISPAAAVAKADMLAAVKAHQRLIVADAAEVVATDLTGQLGGLYVRALAATFRLAVGDTTSVHNGVTILVDAAGTRFLIDDLARTLNGGSLAFKALEQELTLSGASGTTTVVFPNRAIVLGVASRTTLAITGATSYKVGVSGDLARYGDLLGIALNSTNIGVVGPSPVFADTAVIVTANGSNFTAGRVRLILYYLAATAPTG